MSPSIQSLQTTTCVYAGLNPLLIQFYNFRMTCENTCNKSILHEIYHIGDFLSNLFENEKAEHQVEKIISGKRRVI